MEPIRLQIFLKIASHKSKICIFNAKSYVYWTTLPCYPQLKLILTLETN